MKFQTILLLIATVATTRAADRVIAADVRDVKSLRAMVWQDCIGAGRVGEGLRDTWRRHLKASHDMIGFKYLRMHGLFEDELGVYSERNGQPYYNWQYIDDVYDYLLSIGVKPFVEFGFMPKALSSRDDTVFWWKGNVTPPNDYTKWEGLVTAVVKHWTDRYGTDEVKTWRFEVWNEPNISIFWRPAPDADNTTRRDTYFKLYQHTARAVKSVNKDYLVGGPGGAGPAWTKELIDFCTNNSIGLDFISFHAYGLGGGPSGLDPFGNKVLYLNANLRNVAKLVNSQFPIIEQSPMPNLPVHITEWSTSYSPRDPIHDSYFEAPFVLEQLRNTERAASMSYWTFTDIFEENGPVPRPFHGGFGLINFQSIRKPSFWAYAFLAKLGPTEIKNVDSSSFVCTDANGGTQVLLWDLTDPSDSGKISNHELFFNERPAKPKGSVTVQLTGLKPGSTGSLPMKLVIGRTTLTHDIWRWAVRAT